MAGWYFMYEIDWNHEVLSGEKKNLTWILYICKDQVNYIAVIILQDNSEVKLIYFCLVCNYHL